MDRGRRRNRFILATPLIFNDLYARASLEKCEKTEIAVYAPRRQASLALFKGLFHSNLNRSAIHQAPPPMHALGRSASLNMHHLSLRDAIMHRNGFPVTYVELKCRHLAPGS